MVDFIRKVYNSSRGMAIRQYYWNLFVNGILMSYLIPASLRCCLLNWSGMSIKGTIHGHCTILTNKLCIAENSFINRNCFIDNNAMINIGKNCSIGYNVSLVTTNHRIGSSDKRGGKLEPMQIEIYDGCWIGAGCTILPGTIIENSCVIAAGSVVKGICKSNRLYAGVPAKEIRLLDK